MKGFLKRWLAVLLACFCAVGQSGPVFAAEDSTEKVGQQVHDALYGSGHAGGSVPFLQEYARKNGFAFGTVGGEWMALALSRAREGSFPSDLRDAYYRVITDAVNGKNGDNNFDYDDAYYKHTEYSRVVLAWTAMGYDAHDIAGRNFIAHISDFGSVTWQGINGSVFALIAADSGNYDFLTEDELQQAGIEPEDGATTRQRLIEDILLQEIPDTGGWNLGKNPTSPDADTTAMAIQALAPYYASDSEVTAAVDRALGALSKMQSATGAFASYGSYNTESCVQVLVALCALGLDPLDELNGLVKPGGNVISALLSFQQPDGSFSHGDSGGDNQMATEQATYGLVAYMRFLNGENSLYDMSDVTPGQPPEQEQDGLSALIDELYVEFEAGGVDEAKLTALCEEIYAAKADERLELTAQDISALDEMLKLALPQISVVTKSGDVGGVFDAEDIVAAPQVTGVYAALGLTGSASGVPGEAAVNFQQKAPVPGELAAFTLSLEADAIEAQPVVPVLLTFQMPAGYSHSDMHSVSVGGSAPLYQSFDEDSLTFSVLTGILGRFSISSGDSGISQDDIVLMLNGTPLSGDGEDALLLDGANTLTLSLPSGSKSYRLAYGSPKVRLYTGANTAWAEGSFPADAKLLENSYAKSSSVFQSFERAMRNHSTIKGTVVSASHFSVWQGDAEVPVSSMSLNIKIPSRYLDNSEYIPIIAILTNGELSLMSTTVADGYASISTNTLNRTFALIVQTDTRNKGDSQVIQSMDYDALESRIENAEWGDNIAVWVDEDSLVPRRLFDALKAAKTNVTLCLYTDEYQWSFVSHELGAPLMQDWFDPWVDLSGGDDISRRAFPDDDHLVISFRHQGNLPGRSTLLFTLPEEAAPALYALDGQGNLTDESRRFADNGIMGAITVTEQNRYVVVSAEARPATSLLTGELVMREGAREVEAASSISPPLTAPNETDFEEEPGGGQTAEEVPAPEPPDEDIAPPVDPSRNRDAVEQFITEAVENQRVLSEALESLAVRYEQDVGHARAQTAAACLWTACASLLLASWTSRMRSSRKILLKVQEEAGHET